MYGCTTLLKYLYSLATSLRTHYKIISLKNEIYIFLVFSMKKYFVDVDGLFYVCKMMEIHHKKNSDTSLIFIYLLKKFIVISNTEYKKFQKHLMLELFICLKLEFFFLSICNFNFLAILLLFTFFLEFSLFSPFFPNKNYQVRKIENQKKHVG
jgi:hypothetical protein